MTESHCWSAKKRKIRRFLLAKFSCKFEGIVVSEKSEKEEKRKGV